MQGISLRAGEPREVPYDEEVAGVPHLVDDAELKLQPVDELLLGVLAVAPLEAVIGDLAEVVLVRQRRRG